jgi:hypothetical protein
MPLWISGRSPSENPLQWELNGVFESQEAAEEACTTPEDWVGPIVLNQRMPEGRITHPDGYYPAIEGRRKFTFEELDTSLKCVPATSSTIGPREST